MNKIFNLFRPKFSLLFCLLMGAMYFGQPSTPPGGGAGGTTPGAQASPIDDYLFLLIPLAVVMIIYFAKKYRKQLN